MRYFLSPRDELYRTDGASVDRWTERRGWRPSVWTPLALANECQRIGRIRTWLLIRIRSRRLRAWTAM